MDEEGSMTLPVNVGEWVWDSYIRTGLDLAQREMITFCFLAAQGGCEPQLTAHTSGNKNAFKA